MQRLMSHLSLIVVFFLCSTTLWAVEATKEGALNFVKSTVDNAVSDLEAQKDSIQNNTRAIYPLIDRVVLPHFDFELMAKSVLGRSWNDATPQQQAAFVKEFRALLVRTYAVSLVESAGTQVTVSYDNRVILREGKRVTALVKTKVARKGKATVAIDYDIYFNPSKNTWQVFNITAEGVSLVTNYRGQYADKIKTVGIDGLVKELNNLNVKEQK
jgi:phospholipid transport system substrate-binding protein